MKTIGIIGDRDTFRRNNNYYNAIEECGAKAVPLVWGQDIPLELSYVDGFLIPGGGDINPSRYGQLNSRSTEIDDYLDGFEFGVVSEALEQKKPILGICRGHQLINVIFGGTLIQHLDNFEEHVWIDEENDNTHQADIVVQDSFLGKIYGKQTISVNSAHHQAIDRPGDNLIVAAKSPDGVIEAVQHETLPVYGVQFHPERMCLGHARPDVDDGLEIFKFFLDSI